LYSKKIQKNITANLLGTAVTSFSAVITAPLIFRMLGAEAYGLVGLYLLIQSMLPLFDAELTAGLSRAVAWHCGKSDLGKAKTLIQGFQYPLTIMVVIFMVTMMFSSDYFANNWSAGADSTEINLYVIIILISLALGLRMYGAINRAALMALELQVKSNIVQSVAAFSRTLGALFFAYLSNTGIMGFFVLQPIISLLEWLAYRYVLVRNMAVDREPVEKEEIRKHLKFSLYIAGLSFLWVFTSQVEKIYLTSNLSLASYGAYALGVQIASTVILAVATIHGAVLPRLTRYASTEDFEKIRALYGTTTVFTIAVAATITVGIYLTSANIFPSLAVPVNGINPMQVAWIYSIGNCAIAITTLAYLLQNALGKLRIHTIGAILSAFIQIPLMIWAASSGDVIETAITYSVANWMIAAVWLQVVHRRYLAGGALRWFCTYFTPSASVAAVSGLSFAYAVSYFPPGLVWGVVSLFLGTCFTFVMPLLVNADLRGRLIHWRECYAS
jgi:O-antigen/teichoic acid export membrane protein